MVFRFAGFKLDQQRAELRDPDGEAIKLRPKTFEMLRLFAANAGRILSKQDLMEAVWPNIHVGEDSLFQCIREIRTALGDDKRQIIKLVSGRGYLLEAEVSVEAAGLADSGQTATKEPIANAAGTVIASATPRRLWGGLRGPVALATVAAVCAIVGLAIAAPIFRPGLIFKRTAPTVAVAPIVAADNDAEVIAMAAGVTDRLIDGLARIENLRVVTLRTEQPALPVQASASRPETADFTVQGELQKGPQSWTLQARLIRTATREVQSVATLSVDIRDSDLQLQQSRLTAGVGHPLALRLNELVEADARPASPEAVSANGSTRVVIEQATASINQTTRDRFATAQTILENALAASPDNVDLQVALAALQLRGIQMVWYNPAESAAAESNAKSMLERALRARPNHVPVLEAYCRFLNTTNYFIESLVACARTMSFDPWNGLALYHVGLAQLQLGRFEDALATFKQAARYDTPRVSRWTWLLGAGMTYVAMGRGEEALPWLQRSIAITPASGRSHMLLAVAYQQMGRPAEAKAAMDKGLALRPGSNVANVKLPPKNASTAFLEAGERIARAMVETGLPEK